jgi:hypothetical protein
MAVLLLLEANPHLHQLYMMLLPVFLFLCSNTAQLKVSTFLAFILAVAVNTFWPNLIDFPVMLELMFTSDFFLLVYKHFCEERHTPWVWLHGGSVIGLFTSVS